MAAPSTTWRETIADDEDARYQRHAEALVALQRQVSAKHGPGRALHRKQHLGLRATLDVLDGLPEHARHGLFAAPRRYDARVRLSNGSPHHGKDKKPDVRGFAIRVEGVSGDGALGGTTSAQCFLLINAASAPFTDVDDFMGVVLASARSDFAVLGYLIKKHGLFGGLKRGGALNKSFARPFAGFALQPMHSGAPIACGPYAAKVRLLPAGNADAPAAQRTDWAADIRARLAAGPLRWDLQLQFFVDDKLTPIEDPRVDWPEAEAPFVTVARLEVPAQDAAAGADETDRTIFDPWQALAAHRPLGQMMRARKVAYFASQKERGVAT
jgi:hypothetical protein